MVCIMVGMTKDDDALQAAVIDQLNAEIAAARLSIMDFAGRVGRPYDSTRNYLRNERALPLGIFFEYCAVLGVPADVVISRARDRLKG